MLNQILPAKCTELLTVDLSLVLSVSSLAVWILGAWQGTVWCREALPSVRRRSCSF